MGLLNIAGGAGRGLVAADEDNRRRVEFQSMQKQRERLEKQQQEDDRIAAEMRGVRPAGSYDTYSAAEAPGGEGPDTGVPQAAVKTGTTKRTQAQVDRERADALARTGSLRHLAASAALRTSADTAEDRDFMLHNREVQQAALDIGRLNSTPGGHIAAARLLVEKSKTLPKGHQMEITMAPDGTMLLGAEGTPGQPITPDLINKHIVEGQLKYSSPQMYAEIRKLHQGDITAEAAKETAAAHTRTAKSTEEKNIYDTTGAGGETMREYMRQHGLYFDREGQAALMNAQTHRDAGVSAKFGQGIPMTDKNTGETVFLSQDSKTGEWKQNRLPANLMPPKQPQQLSDVQKVAMTAEIAALGKLVEAGTLTQVEADGRMQSIIQKYDQGQSGGFIDTLRKGAPRVPVAPGWGPQVPPATANIMGINAAAMPTRAPGAPTALPPLPKGVPWSPRLSGHYAPPPGAVEDPNQPRTSRIM